MLDRTDSYCERCGSRYAFGPNAPKNLSLKGALVLAKGLKNFVLTDGQSMNDSIALARHEDEHDGTTRMTEEFHRTFNFCMTCRQYACSKCWNARQGACLTCAPEPGFEPVALDDHLIVRTPAARGDSDWALFPEIPGPGVDRGPEVASASEWPTQDLQVTTSDANSGTNGKSGSEHPSRAQAIQEAWSLWPIADELAPEMTLTPEELMLIEAELSHEDSTASAALTEAVAPQALPHEPETEAWTLRRNPTIPSDSPASVVDVPIPLPAGDLAAPMELDAQAVTAQEVAPGPLDAAASEVVELAASEPVAEFAVSEPVAEAVPEAVAPAPASTHERQTGRRLLRRLGHVKTNSQAAAQGEPATAGEPARDPWPRATAWEDRPIVVDWWADAEPATIAPPVAEPSAELSSTSVEAPIVASAADPIESVVSVEPAASEVAAPSPDKIPLAANQQTLFGAVVADAATLAAGDAASTAPAPQLPAPAPQLPAPAPETSRPARPAYASVPPDGATPAHTAVPAREPKEPSPWPPLGASWPAQGTPGAPWPPPNVPSVPAVVAAREAAVPVIADIWAQSAQEVLNRGTVRVCHHCALPVSTQARFCRRCGTRQA
jgi:hypothetical protein